jgi:hypothetical protein
MRLNASRKRGTLAALALLLGSDFQSAPSNPVMRIQLRAIGSARDALQRIAQARHLTRRRL